MGFDRNAEDKEPLRQVELFFNSGRSRSSLEAPLPAAAYIGLGSLMSYADGAPMLTRQAFSYRELEAQVICVRGRLDALLAEAKARFRLAAEPYPSIGE
jgi:hypothetical protein